jgi:hypothetical protein
LAAADQITRRNDPGGPPQRSLEGIAEDTDRSKDCSYRLT